MVQDQGPKQLKDSCQIPERCQYRLEPNSYDQNKATNRSSTISCSRGCWPAGAPDLCQNLLFRKEWMRQTPELWLKPSQQYCGAEFCGAEVRKGHVELGMGAHLGIPSLFLAQVPDLQQLSHFMASFSAVCFD